MKITAITSHTTKKIRQNSEPKQDLTSFKGAESPQIKSEQISKSASDAIKSNFLSNVSFKGHKEEFQRLSNDPVYGTSGAVHTKLTDPYKEVSTYKCTNTHFRGEQNEINKKLLTNSSFYHPNSSIEDAIYNNHQDYKTNRVYFADPEEVVTEQIKKDHDYVVYDNRPYYPKLENIKENYFGCDSIEGSIYYMKKAVNYGEYFNTIEDYYFRSEVADRRELAKLKEEKKELERSIENAYSCKSQYEAQKQPDPDDRYQSELYNKHINDANYFYNLNTEKYNDCLNKIEYYKDRIKNSRMQQAKAVQAFEIFDEVGLMFMDRDNKRKSCIKAKETIFYDTRKIEEYNQTIKNSTSLIEETTEDINAAKQWETVINKKIKKINEELENCHYYDRVNKIKEIEVYQQEREGLDKKINIWNDKIEKLQLKIKEAQTAIPISQNSIKNAQETLNKYKEEIRQKSEEIKSFYYKIEEFYNNNVEDWQIQQ